MNNDFRKNQPALKDVDEVRLPEPERHLLDNGIPVYVIDAGTQELMRIELIFDAGSFYQERSLQAYFTNKCLIEGTASFDAATVAETLDFYGAYLKTGTEKDQAFVLLYTLNKHLDRLLPLLGEVALDATFPDEEVRTIIEKQRQDFLVNMEKVNFIARQNFSRLIFGEEHPYGRMAKAEDYLTIDIASLKDYFGKRYRTAAFSIIVSGKMPQDIIPKLNRYFGKHSVHKANNTQRPPSVKPVVETHFIEKEGALQSAIRLGKPIFNKLHPDYLKFKVLNTLFGGYFGSRLMTNIREDKGYTYGIGSGITSFQHAGMFYISTEVGADVTQSAMDEIFAEIEKLQTEPVPGDELKTVKNYLIGNFLRNADGPFALADLFKGVLPFGLKMDFYRQYISTVKSITAKEIGELAVKYLKPDELVRLIVGDPASKKNH